jgi:hypothetical protein
MGQLPSPFILSERRISMSKAWAAGSTTAWRKTRAEVLKNNLINNQGRCRLLLPEVCTGRATQVHHTLGRAVTGDDPRYLMAVCAQCNVKVGNPATHKDTPSTVQSHWL